ncbi:MAG TPA: TIGR01459 family HAD-type hydrolase [Rhizomicrobium sp.]|jgi:HAD superfamily hydrolase (TIGR01459 family)|nr:TIGR01459 family HAD-type hydrolase [Rhizomicrobium sp.]
MIPHPKTPTGLSEIASDYDALICDVWGVLHDGKEPRLEAAHALSHFRRAHGPVVLLSNAPRPVADIEAQFTYIGVPLDCYDAIVTSGVATREELARRASGEKLAMLHIGPERDRGVFEGLNIECVEVAHSELALCTGLWDDDTETPDDYEELLATLKARDLTMLCANPDIVVQRGGALVYCAGALAKAYEELGGEVVYYGKPHRPIYDMTLATAHRIAGRAIKRPLAIGDGMDTDIKGANHAGIDALFIADGVHAAQMGKLTAEGAQQLFAVPGVHAVAAMHKLVW